MREQTQPTKTDSGTEFVNKRSMTIKIENFGPIIEGTINLKPLTIFVGPNGCGKSHAATLFYTMTKLEQDYDIDRLDWPARHRRELHNSLKTESNKINEQHMNGKNIVYTDVLKNLMSPEAKLKNIIKKNFSTTHETLIQRGKKQSTLSVKSQTSKNIRIKLTSDTVDVEGLKEPKIKIVFHDSSDTDISHLPDDVNNEDVTRSIDMPSQCTAFDIYDELAQRLYKPHRSKKHAYYFPAERAGLTLAHRSIMTTSLYRKFDHNLSDVATDYLAFLISLSDKETAFADMAKNAEKEIMQGEITASPSPKEYPTIYFRRSGYKFPLHMTASSVKDLAPFFLYLKFVAETNDLVILEEPEINLHPASQILLAKFIVRLVNEGLYIVITTHSPYFLEQISHCVKAGYINNDGVNSVLPENERISPSDIASYKFLRRGRVYRIADMAVSSEGIPQDEFLNIDESLYNELLRLRQLEQE